jgi:ferredoxin
MAKVMIEQDHEGCIGCGACVAVYSIGWEMGDEGKSNLKGSKKRADSWTEKEATEEEAKHHQEAAESCPVNVIHVTVDGKKVI